MDEQSRAEVGIGDPNPDRTRLGQARQGPQGTLNIDNGLAAG
jgi:hypothetical protein